MLRRVFCPRNRPVRHFTRAVATDVFRPAAPNLAHSRARPPHTYRLPSHVLISPLRSCIALFLVTFNSSSCCSSVLPAICCPHAPPAAGYMSPPQSSSRLHLRHPHLRLSPAVESPNGRRQLRPNASPVSSLREPLGMSLLAFRSPAPAASYRTLPGRPSTGTRPLSGPRHGKTVNFVDVENQMQTPHSSARKRKNPYISPETSPAQSSPSKRPRFITPPPFEILEDQCPFEKPVLYAAPIRKLNSLGGASRRLQRSFGGIHSLGRGFRRDHCASWQDQTSNFYSSSDDLHQLPQGAPPFCTASCNSMLMRILPSVPLVS